MQKLSKSPHHALISTNNTNYVSIVMLIAASLNFLAGINIDMYSPSMPAIAEHFMVSVSTVKSTIAISIAGWSLGCLVFGALIDALGRKTVISFGLFCYLIASFLAVDSQSFLELIVLRFIQGIMVSTVTIGCRALIIDSVTGKRYAVAMLYASLAYSCGAVFGPLIGGILQYHFGWRTNFIALGIVGIVLLFFLALMINESLLDKQSLSSKNIFFNYLAILKNKNFVAGILVVTLSNIELMLYPTIGPFIVENVLHYNAIIYGYTALAVSMGYLCGAILCRYLLHLTSLDTIYRIAFGILISAVITSYIFSLLFSLNLLTLLVPMILLNGTVGLITPNIMGTNLKLFPKIAGLAMAVQVSAWALFTAFGIFIISHISMNNLFRLTMLYLTLVTMQLIVFFRLYTKSSVKVRMSVYTG